MLLALASLFVFGLLRWRLAVGAALFLAVFDGALRKWIMPDSQQYVYFFKDAVLLGAYIAYFLGRARRREALIPDHPANVPLLLLAALALVQVLNPMLPTLVVGALGIKAHLMYVPLMFLISDIVGDRRKLHVFSRVLVVVSLVPLLLGFAQFQAPADSELNRYAWESAAADRAVFGSVDRVRITGTFSYISGYASYLVFSGILAIVISIQETGWRRYVLYALLGSVLVNLAMTGSRGPLLILGVGVTLLLIMTSRFGNRRIKRAVAPIVLVLPLVVVASHAMFPEVDAALSSRIAEGGDITERVEGALYGPVGAVGEAGLFGYGIGSTHQAMALIGSSGQAGVPEAEGEWERIILELGPFGFVLVLLSRMLVARTLWLSIGRSPMELRPFVIGALVFVTVNLTGDIIFNQTNGILYWLAAGFGLVPGKFRERESANKEEFRARYRRAPANRGLPWRRPVGLDSSKS